MCGDVFVVVPCRLNVNNSMFEAEYIFTVFDSYGSLY